MGRSYSSRGNSRDIAAMLSGAAGLPPDRLRAITAAIQSAQREHWGPEDAE